jgi:hypothetical protein
MQVQGATPTPPTPGGNKANRLQELKDLFDSGTITADEYADARASILRS